MSTLAEAPVIPKERHEERTRLRDSFVTVAEVPGIDGVTWRLLIADSLQDPHLRNMVRNLGHRSADPNPFFELPILEPAAAFIGKGKIRYLCLVRDTLCGSRQLMLFAPIIREPRPFRKPTIRVWTHPYGPLGTPLTEAEDLDCTISGFVDCLLQADDGLGRGLVFRDLPLESRFFREIYSRVSLAGRSLRFGRYTRAGFHSREALESATTRLSGKRRQRFAKAWKRLQQMGKVELSTADAPDQVASAFARQLFLEDRSWKGRAGTSILRNHDALEFTTAAVRSMAGEACCRIHCLS